MSFFSFLLLLQLFNPAQPPPQQQKLFLPLTAAGVPSAGTGSGPGTGAPPGSGNTDAAGAMFAMHSSISSPGTCSCSRLSLRCCATVQKWPRWTPRSRIRRSCASAIDLPRYCPGPPKA